MKTIHGEPSDRQLHNLYHAAGSAPRSVVIMTPAGERRGILTPLAGGFGNPVIEARFLSITVIKNEKEAENYILPQEDGGDPLETTPWENQEGEVFETLAEALASIKESI